jgi:hypothetical protein
MRIVRTLTHLFLPHESNNQKAKILHNSSLILLTFGLIFFQLALSFFPRVGPQILGFAANISPDEVIRLTNENRAAAGLSSVSLDPFLTQAAQAKGADMLAKGYWAHVAPDGSQPWNFFTNAGYEYHYAGENLARDFSSPQAAVDAWMNSPSHKDNLLSPKYRDIGVAVVEGRLSGVETTIIVQMFGTRYATASVPVVPPAKAETATLPKIAPTAAPQVFLPSPASLPVLSVPGGGETKAAPLTLISPFTTTKGISLAIIGVLMAILLVDQVVISRRAIMRIGGRAFAHFAFLGMIAVVVLILRAGRII